MREKYESLALADLKAIAKARGLKGTSTMKKAELIELMLAEDEKDKAQGKNVPPKSAPARPAPIRTAPAGRADEKNEHGESRTEGRIEKSEYRAERTEKPEYRTERTEGRVEEPRTEEDKFPAELDSGIAASGILEVMPDGYGFIRCENYLPGDHDVYVAPSQIRRFGLKTGDILEGNTRVRTQGEKFAALLYVKSINGYAPEVAARRCNFEDMTPIFPDERLHLEMPGASISMRIMDLISPVGKGQRGMIVSPPKAGKTTLLKDVAKSIKRNSPDIHLIILLIDERPEEVTDIKEAIEGPNVEVIYSTFDELPDHHKRVAEMVIERGKRLVEHKKDVMILIDSITRLTRAYNLTVPPSDPHVPKGHSGLYRRPPQATAWHPAPLPPRQPLSTPLHPYRIMFYTPSASAAFPSAASSSACPFSSTASTDALSSAVSSSMGSSTSQESSTS
ncbi:transcription termination factor Rho [Lachnospiraceae bacterium]|nr:transcription termination factor Rho [Lachnospiraceae bacterium]